MELYPTALNSDMVLTEIHITTEQQVVLAFSHGREKG